MYKLKDLIPIRPNEFRLQDCDASKVAVFWALNKENDNGWEIDSYPFFDKTEWIVPAQSAPDEVKPLAYPKNKPSESGLYLVHFSQADKWAEARYTTAYVPWVAETVDYFIPIRLNEPVSDADKLKSEKKVNDIIIWSNTSFEIVKLENNNLAFRDNYKEYFIWWDKREVLEMCKVMLDHYNYTITLKEPEVKPLAYPENEPSGDGQYVIHDKNRDVWGTAIWNDEMDYVWDANVDYFIPIRLDEPETVDVYSAKPSDGDWINNEPLGNSEQLESERNLVLDPNVNFTTIAPSANEQFEELKREIEELKRFVGYTVTRKEPEIKPCPNPECKSKQAVYVETGQPPYNYRYVNCDGCGYCGPEADTSAEAIRLHNLIAWRE